MWKKLTPSEKIKKSQDRTLHLKESFEYCLATKAEWVIISPIYLSLVTKTKWDKKCALNLNSYRNRQFHMSNQLKIMYKELMRSQLEWKTYDTPLWIRYRLYWSNKSDLMNVVSVVDKFFCDALQEFWCILEDNVDHVVSIHSEVWWKDVDHPRIEILILQ